MKILNPEQINWLDKQTIQLEPISSVDLMERAASACSDYITRCFEKQRTTILCGPGNNGGDGLVIARHLFDKGWNVLVLILESSNYSEDFEVNFNRLTSNKIPNKKVSKLDVSDISNLVIDCLFGSGLNRQINGYIGNMIDLINQHSSTVVSIDFPSGLFAESHSLGAIIKADYTLSFETQKLSFLLPDYSEYIGELTILPIGWHQASLDQISTSHFYTTRNDIRSLLKQRKRFSHKGTFGHVCLVGGKAGSFGAIILAARSAIQSGAGYVSIHCPYKAASSIHSSVPEAMLKTDEHPDFITSIDLHPKMTFGIGPGLGLETETIQAFKKWIAKVSSPIVMDADAINIVAQESDINIPANSILTPHLKEFERLVGTCSNSFERLEKAKDFCQINQVYLVLKGANTAVICPNKEIHFNSTGNPGMATAGSGDVLTGIITSFLAQGYSPKEAAILGVYFHGLTADRLKLEKGENGFTALDIAQNVSIF